MTHDNKVRSSSFTALFVKWRLYRQIKPSFNFFKVLLKHISLKVLIASSQYQDIRDLFYKIYYENQNHNIIHKSEQIDSK